MGVPRIGRGIVLAAADELEDEVAGPGFATAPSVKGLYICSVSGTVILSPSSSPEVNWIGFRTGLLRIPRMMLLIFESCVRSMVGDVIMPALGKVTGGFNFSDLAVTLGKDPTGKDVLVKYGAFIQTLFDFIIIALVLFIALRAINRLKKPPAAAAPPPPEPPAEVKLLTEIRDLLARR